LFIFFFERLLAGNTFVNTADRLLPWFCQHVCRPISDNLKTGSPVYAICMGAFYWPVGYLLHKKKICLKV
jgi:hypothetical protein